jgi:hypothetical protein
MIRKLLAILLNHPRLGPQLIQRLSETYPIRRAARFTAYLYFKGKLAVEETVKRQATKPASKLPESGKGFDVERFKRNFQEEIQKGLKDAREKKKF